jgi:Fe-S cluster biogenesis protein NfuA
MNMQNWYNKVIKISQDMSSTEAENERINRIRTALEEQEFPQFVNDVGQTVYDQTNEIVYQKIQNWATNIPTALKLPKHNRNPLIEILQIISSDASKVSIQSGQSGGSGADTWQRFQSSAGWDTAVNEYIRNFIQYVVVPVKKAQQTKNNQEQQDMKVVSDVLRKQIFPQFIQDIGQAVYTKVNGIIMQKVQSFVAVLPEKLGLASHNENQLMEIVSSLASDASKVSIQNGQKSGGGNTWQLFKSAPNGTNAINNYIEGFIHNVMPKATPEELAVIQSGK